MRSVPLGELIAKAKSARAGASDYPLLSMTMHGGLVDQSRKFKKRVASDDLSDYKVVKHGQLVVGFPIDEAVLDFQTMYAEGIVSPAYGVWDLREETSADRAFLKRYLRSDRAIAYYKAKLRGSTARRRSLPEPDFLAHPIPLPPLSEQRRIAAILDHADALRAKRRQVMDHLNALELSSFNQMFVADAAWPVQSIESLGVVTTGKTPPTAKQGMFGGSVPFVTPGDLGSVKPVARTLTSAGADESRVVRKGATLVCCIGATIGKVDTAREPSAFNQQINAVEWGPSIDDTYGFAAVRHLKPNIVGRGASTTLPLLPKGQFSKLELPVPPLDQQREFASLVAQIQDQRAAVGAVLSAQDELFASLQSRAFRGEL